MPVRDTAAAVLQRAQGLVEGPGVAADIPDATELAASAARPAGAIPEMSAAFWGESTRPLEVVVHERFERLAKSAKSLVKASTKAREKVLIRHIEELASLLGETPKASIKYGGQLKFIRSMVKNAAKAGWSTGEIGILTSTALYESGAIRTSAGASNMQKVMATYEAEVGLGGATPRLAKGAAAAAHVGKAGRFISSVGRFAKGAAPFAALMGLDALVNKRLQVQSEKKQVQQILEKASGGGASAFGPMQTVEFIEAMGPEFVESLMQDPSLVLALHDKLQSMTTGNLPRGTAVLRSAAGGGVDAQVLLEQLGR
jgi:hypothetical protein